MISSTTSAVTDSLDFEKRAELKNDHFSTYHWFEKFNISTPHGKTAFSCYYKYSYITSNIFSTMKNKDSLLDR